MKNKIYLFAIPLLFIASNILAQEIQYPVAELENCENKEECKVYCDKEEHMNTCILYAEKNNLMTPEEAVMAKKMASGEKGPGGCKDKNACQTYCDDMSHIEECVSFAEQNGLMSQEELADAKKIQKAISEGIKPPACKNKKACDAYCDSQDHMEECMNFALRAGFIQGKEAEDAQKMLQAVKRGIKPPPCKGKEACDEYCNKPENAELCINFAIEAGFMSEEEKQGARGMLKALKQGIKPPPCKGKEECDTYCGEEEHFEECIKFSEAAGFMSAEDAAKVMKNGAAGPGGCKGRECETFCNDPVNKEACFQFAKDHGQIPEEDLRKMEEGSRMFNETLQKASPEVIQCLKERAGKENIEEIRNEEVVRQCFEQFGMPQTPNTAEPGPKQMGPGGCQSPEECETYCSTRREECGAPQEMPLIPQEEFNPSEEEFKSPMEANPPNSIQQPMPVPGAPVPLESPQSGILKLLFGTIFFAL